MTCPDVLTTPDLDAAERFLAGGARVLERRRFERLFRDGDAAPVRDAVAAYRNPDGGFGQGLEPDGRTPVSQPAAVQQALEILHEADAWDDDLVTGACNWLAATAPAAGGTTFVAPGVDGWPHAPWWQLQHGLPPSLITTGQALAPLLARGFEHPWVDGATDACWRMIDRLAEPHAYELRGALAFLDAVGDDDPDRARTALSRIEPSVRDRVSLDPDAPGETHGPLDFAPRAGSAGVLSRRLFDDATIAAHLDHLAAAQQDDGGWSFDWLAWSPAAAAEWRGVMTVRALALLRAHGVA